MGGMSIQYRGRGEGCLTNPELAGDKLQQPFKGVPHPPAPHTYSGERDGLPPHNLYNHSSPSGLLEVPEASVGNKTIARDGQVLAPRVVPGSHPNDLPGASPLATSDVGYIFSMGPQADQNTSPHACF